MMDVEWANLIGRGGTIVMVKMGLLCLLLAAVLLLAAAGLVQYLRSGAT